MADDRSERADGAGASAGDPRHRPAARRRARAVAVLGLSLASLAPWVSGLGWPVDLVAQASAPLAVLTLSLGVWWAIRRRWTPATACLLVVATHAMALAGYRAPRAEASEADLRVVLSNMHPGNPTPLEALGLVMGQGADLIVLTETPRPVYSLAGSWMAGREAADERYPHVTRRQVVRERVPWRVVLSRWPMEPFAPDAEPEVLALRIARPEGPFVVVTVHPASPKTPRRWRDGNRTVEAAVRVAREAAAAGLPVVVAADLNSTPTGWRSRRFGRAGLRRSKPLVAGPTYPYASPLGVAIDDVWVSPGARVGAWRRLAPSGSDHRPVVVDVRLP